MRIAKVTKTSDIKSTNKVDESLGHIKSAIDCLGEVVLSDREDVLAKESIANLSVVLFDLQSHK